MSNLKQQVGIKAAEFVTDGMVVGLGTGSTAYYFVEEIGRRVKEEGLQIVGVTTSHATTAQAESLGIPLKSIDQVDYVDLTVDGADEVDGNFDGIKGGGAALLMEKIVAVNSRDCIWIVDQSKVVDQLGAFKLPVEVVQYGSENLFRKFEEKGYRPSFRMDGESRKITDMKNYIIDLDLQAIEDAKALADELDRTVGVVEHGLFIHLISKVLVGYPDGPKILEVN
ncbi:ribose-5-phosphate isomerase RpiA [Streptococcus sp. X16XC17]|uniref:ribose-5-phosphate isomerase RpiA n=1 Tax=unclassified Streptococcus TaxID=2608887 RepID=UPI00066FCFB1|nr:MULTISPECIES: ribose-5-phosphate isomerase RpiA [unclassified Streptococcus]TCD46476.1 ribose-5-phosphate isomerase RpiA [Streptococcus sp. X16XC17]